MGHAIAMHRRHQAAAALGAALLCGNTETNTSKSLVEPKTLINLSLISFKNSLNYKVTSNGKDWIKPLS